MTKVATPWNDTATATEEAIGSKINIDSRVGKHHTMMKTYENQPYLNKLLRKIVIVTHLKYLSNWTNS